MSDNNDNNHNYTWSLAQDCNEGHSSKYFYPSTSASCQDSAYPTASGSMPLATPQDARDQRWDVEVRAGSFDGDTGEHDLPENHSTANEQAADSENHRRYTNDYINSLEVPFEYRDSTGEQQSSPRRRARRRVRDVVNAEYAVQGSSSGSGQRSGQSSSRHKSSKNHHGHKSSKHSNQNNKRLGNH